MSNSKYRKLSHVVYKCDYHIVWTPKYRYRVLFGEVKTLVENDLRMLCEWKGVDIIEMNVQLDHVHLLCSIAPKVSVSDLLGILKGKLAIKLFKSYPHLKQKPYWGNHFWSRGYFVTTVGVDEEIIKRYIKYQEGEDKKEESQTRNFDLFSPPSET
jgi:putative transposase